MLGLGLEEERGVEVPARGGGGVVRAKLASKAPFSATRSGANGDLGTSLADRSRQQECHADLMRMKGFALHQ